jgi:PKD repeat protein
MKKKYTHLVTFTLFILLSLYSSAQIKIIPYQQLQGSTGIFFGASMSSSTITVTFEGPSNRWIALGFGLSMTPCDALVYSNGQSSALHTLGWNDYYCGNTSASNVTNDVSQDWTILSNNVASGQRTVVASRALSTSDPNDVVISFAASSLNIVWARGASADYTLAYHGNTNRGSGISLPWLSQPVANFTTNTTTVCAGSSVTFSNTSTGGQNTYTWNFAGANLATSSVTNPVITYTAAGNYSVVLTASNAIGTGSIAQLNYITVNPTVVPTVAVSQTGGTNPICSGALASFSASTLNGGPSPSFQWKVNGINSGSNSPTFTSTSLPSSALVSLVMTANSVCAVPNTATSSIINLTVNSSAPASVTIALTGGGNPICSNSTATFTATPGNGGTSPFFQWKINAVNAGGNSLTFTTNTLANGNSVSCDITSSSTCAATSTASSSGITMTVSSVLVPSVSINLSAGSNPMCTGSSVSFSAQPINGGSNPVYQWQLNGNNVGNNNPVFTSFALTGNYLINCIMTSNSPCSSPNSATSTAISLVVNSIPSAPIITPSGTVSFCSSKNLTLTSSAASGNNWSTGSTGQSIVITSAGNYSLTRTVLGCSSPPSSIVQVQVIPSPTVSLNQINLLCKDDATVSLIGNPPGGLYTGTGVSGSNFNPLTSGSGTFIATYQYTATNNCVGDATTSIVVSECLSTDKLSNENNAVLIYPNPSKGLFTVTVLNQNIQHIKVTDSNFASILDKKIQGLEMVEINLQKNSSGIYFIELQLADKIIRAKILLVK